jgi:type I restriction enzyme S subunit
MVFYLTEEGKKIIDPQWLYIYFHRKEFRREVTFRNFGSQRPEFNFNDMSDIVVPLPPLPVQQKYVDIYNAMVANQQSYERGLEDLKLTVDALIEKFKHNTKRVLLGNIVEESDARNDDGSLTVVQGVNKDKQFMPTVASGAELTKYKIVTKNQFACNLMHVGRDVAIPISLQKQDKDIIVSPAYLVFSIKDESVIPEYALIWMSRCETERYAWFISDTSIRGGIEKGRFYEIDIPVPTVDEQKSLVEIYNALSLRKNINERLKAQIKEICPILIKGSMEEGQ